MLRVMTCLAFGLLFFLETAAAGPEITSVFPPSQTVTASRSTDISVTFDVSLNPSTINATSFLVFGRWSGVATGTITLEEGNSLVRFIPDKPFMAGEWVTVSLAKNIQEVDGTPMERGNPTTPRWPAPRLSDRLPSGRDHAPAFAPGRFQQSAERRHRGRASD